MSSFLKPRPHGGRAGGGEDGLVVGLDPDERFPALVEFLVRDEWSPGVARTPGSLSLFYDAGRVKGCLSDRDALCVAFTAGTSLEDVLVRLEEGLRGDSLEWRAMRERPRAKR